MSTFTVQVTYSTWWSTGRYSWLCWENTTKRSSHSPTSKTWWSPRICSCECWSGSAKVGGTWSCRSVLLCFFKLYLFFVFKTCSRGLMFSSLFRGRRWGGRSHKVKRSSRLQSLALKSCLRHGRQWRKSWGGQAFRLVLELTCRWSSELNRKHLLLNLSDENKMDLSLIHIQRRTFCFLLPAVRVFNREHRAFWRHVCNPSWGAENWGDGSRAGCSTGSIRTRSAGSAASRQVSKTLLFFFILPSSSSWWSLPLKTHKTITWSQSYPSSSSDFLQWG